MPVPWPALTTLAPRFGPCRASEEDRGPDPTAVKPCTRGSPTPLTLLHERGQPVHALAEVDRLGREQDAHARRDRDHASPRTTSSTRRSAVASTSAPTRTTAGPSAISIRPYPVRKAGQSMVCAD